MHPDLALLVELQRIDSAIAAARKGLADIPAREATVEARLTAATAGRDTARQRVADNKTARGAAEKDLGVVQSRLDRFKDQTMAVKTNKEFHALQHEIAVAQEEIRKFEDRVLELMVEGDEITAAARKAERSLADAEREALEARRQLGEDRARFEREIESLRAEREAVTPRLSRPSLALFTSAGQSAGGVAVTPIHEGHCGLCHVRLRPHVTQAIVAGETIVQCESCGRILYHARPAPGGGEQTTSEA
jgi:predicted  nucleic acid-binding Zn-ribbon protein